MFKKNFICTFINYQQPVIHSINNYENSPSNVHFKLYK